MKKLLLLVLILTGFLAKGQTWNTGITKPTGTTSLQSPYNVAWYMLKGDTVLGANISGMGYYPIYSIKKVRQIIDSLASVKVDKTTTINGYDLSTNRTLTTSDINSTSDKRYVTDAEKVVIGNTSGVNTGDQDLTGLVHSNRTALDAVSGVNTGDQDLSGLQSKLNGTGFVKASGTTISYDNSTYLPYRTFGTAANNNTGDFQPTITGLTTNYLPKWNGSQFVNSAFRTIGTDSYIDGNLDIQGSGTVLSRIYSSAGTPRFDLQNAVGRYSQSIQSDGSYLLFDEATGVTAWRYFKTGTTSIPSTTPSTSTTTGALVVGGGIGVGGNGYFGGSMTIGSGLSDYQFNINSNGGYSTLSFLNSGVLKSQIYWDNTLNELVYNASSNRFPGNITVGGNITATSFIKSGGTSAQYLLADGSVTTVAGAVYKGEMNGSTGSGLSDGVGTTGWYYACSTAGTHNYGSGNITLAVGDQLYYNGSVWLKIPGAGSYTLPVATASTLGGVKQGTGTSISGDGTLSITFPAYSVVASSGSYTDLINKPTIPTNTNQLTNGAGFITGITSTNVTTALGYTPYNATNPSSYISRTGISSTATGLTYTSSTGVLSLTSGYSIPTTANQTNWISAYTNMGKPSVDGVYGNLNDYYFQASGGEITPILASFIGSDSRPPASSTVKSALDLKQDLLPDITTPVDLSTTSNTLSVTDHRHGRITVSSSQTITLSNPVNGATGNIKIIYSGSSAITIGIPAGYVLNMASNIKNSGATMVTKSSGKAAISYWICGSDIFLNGTFY